MTVKKRSTTGKKPVVSMIPSQPANKAENRCRYLGDDDSPCPLSAVGTSNFCEQHTHWFDVDLAVYKAVGEHFRQDLREFWVKSNFYLLIQAGLLSVFVSISNRTSRPELAISIMLILLGEVLAVVWFLVARGSLIWIRLWRDQIIAIDEVIDRHQRYSKVEREVKQKPFSSPSHLTQLLPLVFCLAWLALLGVLLFF
jgi:hypothetical protein